MASYLRTTNLEEALAALTAGRRVPFAGGTDIYPARVGQSVDDDILDISGLPGLRGRGRRAYRWRLRGHGWDLLLLPSLPQQEARHKENHESDDALGVH